MVERAPDPLQVIRSRIDRIDEAMHRLLIDRSEVIAELIEIKGTAEPGAAFRPGREADMMRRLVQRHEGDLPLTTVEHIWREIITSFTAMQAPFGIAAGPAEDALAMRDAIRFTFGFSVAVTSCPTAEAAIARVAASGTDIAVLAAGAGGRWWDAVAGPKAPKVFAKLPFIETPARPASLPAYVIGPPLRDAALPDIRLYAVSAAAGLEPALLSRGGRIADRDRNDRLVELPMAATLDDIAGEIGAPLQDVRDLGGFAQPIHCVAARTA